MQHSVNLALSVMHAALFDLSAFLVIELGMMFAPGKCFIISNNQQCSLIAQRSFGEFGGQAAQHVSRLGVPYSINKKLTKAVISKRVRPAILRSHKLKILLKTTKKKCT